MALLHMDGFDGYATFAQTAMRYSASSGSLNLTGGRFGGGCLSSSTYLDKAISGSPSTIIMGAAFHFTGQSTTIFTAYNASGYQCHVYYNAGTGFLEARLGSGSTVIGTSTPAIISTNVWHFIEVKATIGNSGSIEVRLNGNAVINLSGVDTQGQTASDVTKVGIQCYGTGTTGCDDWYVLDSGGSAPLNDFLGDIRITTIRPTADSSVAWTRSTGASNYLAVDDTTVDAVDYVGSSTVGQRDVYDLGDLTGSPTVYAMQANAWGLKTDAGTRGVKVGLRYSGTETQTADLPMTTTTSPYTLTGQATAPGAVAWTSTVVNATQLTLELAS